MLFFLQHTSKVDKLLAEFRDNAHFLCEGEKNADAKLKVNYKEVYYNQQNQTELTKTIQQYCPELMESGGIGVPTGFDPVNKKCIQGDTPIIDFLSSKLAN